MADGALDEPIIPYHVSKAFLDSKKFEIRTDSSIIVEELAKLVVTLVDLLGSRNWMLAEAVGSQFVTSNKPVSPIWSMGFIKLVPGFRLTNSLVTFPLTPNLALLGSWSPLPSYQQVDSLIVEGINWATTWTGADVIYTQKHHPLPTFRGVFHLQEFHRLFSDQAG